MVLFVHKKQHFCTKSPLQGSHYNINNILYIDRYRCRMSTNPSSRHTQCSRPICIWWPTTFHCSRTTTCTMRNLTRAATLRQRNQSRLVEDRVFLFIWLYFERWLFIFVVWGMDRRWRFEVHVGFWVRIVINVKCRFDKTPNTFNFLTNPLLHPSWFES